MALYGNLDDNEDAALKLHNSIISEGADDWRGNRMKEKAMRIIIRDALQESNIDNEDTVEKIFQIVSNQDEY